RNLQNHVVRVLPIVSDTQVSLVTPEAEIDAGLELLHPLRTEDLRRQVEVGDQTAHASDLSRGERTPAAVVDCLRDEVAAQQVGRGLGAALPVRRAELAVAQEVALSALAPMPEEQPGHARLREPIVTAGRAEARCPIVPDGALEVQLVPQVDSYLTEVRLGM